MSKRSIANDTSKVQLGDSVAAPTVRTESQQAEMTFADFASLGYRLIPVIPPGAPVSPLSNLAKRKGELGKIPGIMRPDGRWMGFKDWQNHEDTEEDHREWQRMGASIGIKTGRGLIAIDADTMNEQSAKIIRDMIEAKLGRLPVRIGRYPKALYVCRVSSPMKYTRLRFGDVDEKGRPKDQIEILSDGKQFVAWGLHSITKRPYEWPRGVAPINYLPSFDPDQVLH